MKLCKIEHERCDSYDSTSYVLAPDDMTQEQFEGAVARARSAYIEFAQKWSATAKAEHPGYQPDYAANPDKTVAQVKAEFDAKKAAYDEWYKQDRRAQRSFKDYLVAEGFKFFWDDDVADLETTLYWGHNHGLALDYELPLPSDQSTALQQPEKSTSTRI